LILLKLLLLLLICYYYYWYCYNYNYSSYNYYNNNYYYWYYYFCFYYYYYYFYYSLNDILTNLELWWCWLRHYWTSSTILFLIFLIITLCPLLHISWLCYNPKLISMLWTRRQQKILIYIQVQMKNVPGNSYILLLLSVGVMMVTVQNL